MSESAKWVEILQGFTKFNNKQMLKVSAWYLEKQKSFIHKEKYSLSRTAKIDPKDGVRRPNFQWRFWLYVYLTALYKWMEETKDIPIASYKNMFFFQQDACFSCLFTYYRVRNKRTPLNKRSPLENLAKIIIVAPFLPYTMKSGIRP